MNFNLYSVSYQFFTNDLNATILVVLDTSIDIFLSTGDIPYIHQIFPEIFNRMHDLTSLRLSQKTIVVVVEDKTTTVVVDVTDIATTTATTMVTTVRTLRSVVLTGRFSTKIGPGMRFQLS